MPTISVNRHDLEQLIVGTDSFRRPVTLEQLEAWLPLVKGEIKGQSPDTGELRVELQDSNRPDLWCTEGIARQVRIMLAGHLPTYPFFTARERPHHQLIVTPGLEQVRPYVAACAAVGYTVSEEGLAQLIQTQEKLADIFGRKRRMVSIGLYRLPRIVFPVTYGLVMRDEVSFTTLGLDTVMTLGEMLMVHPKGLEYGPILANHDRVPLLRDAKGQVLSFPPIINSREIGDVQVGDQELFVEVTGTDLAMVVLTLNILAANLADRGATIQPVEIQYPSKTDLGECVVTPSDCGKPRAILIKTIESALGQSMGGPQIGKALAAYGYEVSPGKDKVTVKLPPYRNDLMHPVDVVEDVAISCGYDSFVPVMPSQFTVGSLSRSEQVSDRVRDLMIGMGFQEIISNIMSSRQELCEKMRVDGGEWAQVVEVENVMTQSFSCLRQWLIPSLLKVEAASSRAFYPHRVFEVGEVVLPDQREEVGSRTLTFLGAMMAHAGANFSEIHSCLDLLLYYLDHSYQLEVLQHPSFLAGRAGRIVANGVGMGLIGELHPEVLERWQIGVPVVVFDLDLRHISPGD